MVSIPSCFSSFTQLYEYSPLPSLITFHPCVFVMSFKFTLLATISDWLFKEVAIKWSAAPDMTPQTVLYRRPVAQFSNFQPKIV
ncbi:hypothetical protein, partial [Providencia huaxiensis]|uniref:hypothetical protein n=1 Tax=Providencia huaxiensis TaxID=2027290 RepID=UPI0039F4BFE8